MEPSNFLEWVNKYFPGIVIRVVQTLNGTTSPRTYLYQSMLTKTFSLDGKWEALSVSGQVVTADYVAMDSSLPLKRRAVVGKANGVIPKSGMEFHLNEQQLTDLDTLVALGTSNQLIVAKLFQDVPNAISAIYEKNEAAFLQGLSSGVTLIQDDDKQTGVGIRVDFGYLTANKFVAAIAFSNAASKPFDQLKRLTDKALLDGNVITVFMLDGPTLDAICNTDQAKQLYAFRMGFVGNAIPVPSLDQINDMTKNRYGYIFQKVDRSIVSQKNGKNTTYKPWTSGSIVGITGPIVGDLVWARLAEMGRPVPGVSYQTADDYILVSQYRQNKPSLSEVTSSQARVLPVISNVDQIYLLDSNGPQTT